MFDIGFFELFVIAIIGLFVVGPERLPSAVKTCALWIGRVKHAIRETRTEFEKQIGADEIRRELHNEQVMRSLEALKKSKDELSSKLEESTNSILPNFDHEDLPDHYPHDESGLAITDQHIANQHGQCPETSAINKETGCLDSNLPDHENKAAYQEKPSETAEHIANSSAESTEQEINPANDTGKSHSS